MVLTKHQLTQLRANKPYTSERELIKTVLANLGSFVGQKQWTVACTELPVGTGYVDVVIGITNHSAVRQPPVQEAPLTATEALVLSKLYKYRALSFANIAKRCMLSQFLLESALRNLLGLKLVEARGYSTFVRSEASERFTGLIAIEGKLTRWEQALAQAYRNRLYCKKSYVVLDARHIRPALDNLDRFRYCGVGLAVANAETETVQIILRASTTKPVSRIHSILAQDTLYSCFLKDAALQDLKGSHKNELPPKSFRSPIVISRALCH